MSSTSPRQGLSKTLRSTKTRFVAVFAFVILTAVFSASALTASNGEGTSGASGFFDGPISSFFGGVPSPTPPIYDDFGNLKDPNKPADADRIVAYSPEAVVVVAGTTVGGPTWNRPLGGNPPVGLSGAGPAVPFSVAGFTVNTTDTYTLNLDQTGPFWDTFACVYSPAFDPAFPLLNALECDDDSGPGVNSQITRAFTAGVQYFFVATGFSNGDFGTFTLTATSAGANTATFVPAVYLASAASTVNEITGQPLNSANYIVHRGFPTTAISTVTVSSLSGSAIGGGGSGCAPGNDFLLISAPGTVTFAPGVLTQQFGVEICDDAVAEAAETFSVSLGNPVANSIIAAPSTNVTTINDDDTTVSVAVAPASVLENGVPNLNYTFTRSSAGAGALTVNFATAGTATGGAACGAAVDFTPVAGAGAGAVTLSSVTFSAASLTAVWAADPCPDALVEPNENVDLTISAGSYVIGNPNTASGSITNDDFSTIDFNQAILPTVDEGNPDLTNIVGITLVRTQPVGSVLSDLTVRFSLTGTATCATGALQDYTVSTNGTFDPTTCTGTATFTGTGTTRTFAVTTVSDIRIEADETVIATILPALAPLTNANNYNVGGTIPTSTATINDDDETITVDATVVGSPISEAGPGGMTFNVNRIFGSNGGPAPAVTDAQSINFSLSSLTPTGTQTICTGADYTVSGVGVVYNAPACTGTIAIPGSTVFAAVVVTPVNDATPESDETVTLTITPNSSGAAGNYGIGTPDANGVPSGTATATGTILNDDIQVIVNVAPAQVLEDGVPNLIYTFTRIGDSASVVTANFTASGSASPLSDYVVTGATTFNMGSGQGTVAFPAGNNTTVGTVNARTFLVTVDPTADTTVEPDEEVQVQVDNGVGYLPGTPNLASGLIINDDTVVTVAVAPSSSNEDLGPNMVYTFTRTGNFGVALNVPFTVTGTAIANDYTGTAPGAQVAVFAAGNSTTTVTVDPTADTTVEPDETVIATLDTPAPGSGYTLGAPASATGTIVNDDTDVTVAVAPSSIFENAAAGQVMTYTFSRTGLINGNLTVNFSTTGTATSGTDYAQSSTGTVTFTGANTNATVTVDPSPDSDVENDETVILTVLPGTGYNVSGAPATGTITSDDVDVQLAAAVANTPVQESGTNNLIYTIQRVGLSTTQEVTVAFTIGGGTNPATCGDDYDVLATAGVTFSNAAGCAGTGTAVIAAGAASTTVTVDPRADFVVETDETVRVTLTSCAGSGASAGLVNTCDLVAALFVDGVITNDDTDVNIAVAPPTIVEDAAGVMTYTFTRNTSAALLALPLNVNYNSSGTACTLGPCADTFTTDAAVGIPSGSTYAGTNGTGTGATSFVVFAAGSTTAVITVDPTADTNVEPDETVILTIVAGTGYVPVTNASATGTIRDEDSSVQFTSATFTHNPEGSGGGTTIAALTVSRNGPGSATSAAQVDASTIQVGGTATGSNSCAIAGTDYVVISGQTITWAAAEAGNKPFNITICADNVDEANEILNSQLSNFIGTQIGSPINAVTTIVDDDNAPAFALTPPTTTVAEGATATYTVTRSGNETQLSTTVTWAATGITATGGTDFSPVTGTVTFAAGTGGTQTFTINAATDLLFEGNETYGVALTAATNGSTFSGTNTTTITDGQTAPTVAINDVTQVELNSGQSAFIFTITRTGDAQANQTMTFSTQDGVGPATPATAPSDYTAVIGDTVTFTQGQTSRQVAVIVNGDVIFEDDETFRAILTNFNFGSATRATGIGTITNDDSAPVFNLTATVGSPNETVTEGSGVGTTVARFTITKTGATELTSIVSGSTVNGSAVAPGDFTAIVNAALATFSPSDTVKTFDVNIVRDTIRENTETFTVNLTNVTNGTFGPNTSGTGTINDDEPNPNFVLSAVSASNPEGTAATFLVTMNFPSGTTGTEVSSTLSCSSSVISANSTIHATSGDFSVTSNSISFAAGAATGSTQPCSFSTVNDTFFEGAETFNVALAGSSGAIGTVTGTPQTATITNNDGCTFVANNFSDTEGNAGTKSFTHPVVKTCDTGAFNAIVGYASSDGTATNPVDYTEIVPGNLNYTPATTSLPLVVSVNGDLTVEPDETYNVLLTGATINGVAVNAANCGVAVCAVTSGVGTILNDDGVPISITGTITNFGGGAAVGVTVTLSGSTAATTTTNVSGVYTFTNLPSGGNFLVTPTAPAGTVASPTTRSYTGITSSVANANFVLYQSGAIPRTVNVINSYTNPGSPVTVPITLTAQGDEAALSFTLTYNSAILTAPAVACGNGSVGCALTVNTATPGVITVSVEAQDGGGNPAVYAAGTRVVINVTFGTNVTAAVNTPIAFTSVPTQQRVSDSASNPLPTVWNNGFVVFGQGIEADVAPRNSGDGQVQSTDVIQVRRFVTNLDTPSPNFNEFQRADSAPAGTKGDGNLNASDVIQVRRYSAGLDLTQSAGGPFVANPPAPAPERAVGGKGSTDAPESVGTIIRAGNSTGVAGTQVFLDINLDHVVSDRVVAMQTSVQFDPTKLSISGISTPGTNPDVTLGTNVPAATSLTVNANQVAAGRIGFLADSFPELWAPGTNRQIVRLRFTIAVGAAPGLTPITLISTPVPQSISNDSGIAVTFTNENGSVLITNPPTAAGVTVGGRILTPTGAGLRGATVSITDGNGVVRTVTTSTFGYYQFEEVEAGNNYVVAVASRRYRFTPRLIQVIDNLTDVDFTGQN